MSLATDVQDQAAARAEHDALAARLEIRRSVDLVRRGAYLGFTTFLGALLAGKLAWDRWGPPRPGVVRKLFHGPPLFFFLAVVATVVLLVLTARALRAAARLRAEEDALFARFRALRQALRLDL